jgi:hypothetical protein
MQSISVGNEVIDISGWEHIGTTQNSDHYLAEPDIIATIYREGSVDVEHTAREQLNFQHDYISKQGRKHGLLVFIDTLVSQDAASRRVYSKEPRPELFNGVALVGGTRLSRGVASFFIGISRLLVEQRFFATYREAMGWLRAKRDQPGEND